MINSFRDAEAGKIFRQEFSKKHQAISRSAQRRLALLQSAKSLEDLQKVPGNHLETLKGGREGQHSIRVNDQYRICFRWTGTDAEDVEIVDYH